MCMPYRHAQNLVVTVDKLLALLCFWAWKPEAIALTSAVGTQGACAYVHAAYPLTAGQTPSPLLMAGGTQATHSLSQVM